MEQDTNGNMSKLLHKPFRAFTLYALLILAASIPAYYWVVEQMWFQELDEHNWLIKNRIEKRFAQSPVSEAELQVLLQNWNTLQPSTTLTPAPNLKKSHVYTTTKVNEEEEEYELERFRGLSSYLTIHGQPYHLRIETSVEEADDTILAIAGVTVAFFTLLVVGFIFLNKKIARKIWQPFHYTLNQLKTFDLTKDTHLSFKETDIEEFNELNQSLQKWIDRNTSVYQQQKKFIENASHELQTPLAVLRSKIDMLLQQESLTSQQSVLLAAIEQPLARMSRINKNLLLLAKMENSQFAETTRVNVAVLIEESLDLLHQYIEDKHLQTRIRIHPLCMVSCHPFLLETLLYNLLTNAIRHTQPRGCIQIECLPATLCIRNSGTAPLQSARLFERFATLSPEVSHSGLGLAIVQEIANRYGWHISYAFENELHVFSLAF